MKLELCSWSIAIINLVATVAIGQYDGRTYVNGLYTGTAIAAVIFVVVTSILIRTKSTGPKQL